MNRTLVVAILGCCVFAPVVAQVAQPCAGPEYRQFDFWIGDWTVRTADGAVVGRNNIRALAGGCGLVEHWRSARGDEGMSLNAFDLQLGHWTQRWVGTGAVLWLQGGVVDGVMVLAGTLPRPTPHGAVLDRIQWMPLNDGRVRQLWEVSPDGGATWQPHFDGYYSRHTGGGSAGDGGLHPRPPSYDF